MPETTDMLVTLSIGLHGVPREYGREIAKQIRDGIQLIVLSELEQRGLEPDEAAPSYTFYAPTLTYPLSLRADGQ